MIFGKVGRIGHGKTMRAVVDAVELATFRSAILASNIRIRPPASSTLEVVTLPMDGFSDAFGRLLDEARECSVCTVLNDWDDVAHGEPGCERRGVVALIDEVDTIWDAREWADMSKLDRFRIKQSRKLGCDLIWTAQFVDQVEKGVRNITEEVELLRAFPPPSLSRRERGKRPWFLIGQHFRPGAVRELTATVDPDRRLGRSIYRYRREHERLYNTDELVRPEGDLTRVRSRRSKSSPEVQAASDGGAGAVNGLMPNGAIRAGVPAEWGGADPDGRQVGPFTAPAGADGARSAGIRGAPLGSLDQRT